MTVSASADNTLFNESDDLSNGAGQYLFAGRTQSPSPVTVRRGLVRFDVSSAVPAGSTINSATLRLYASRTQAFGETISVHVVQSDWGEGASAAGGMEGGGGAAASGDATWAYTFYDAGDPVSSPAWSSAGGDFAGAASDSVAVAGLNVYFEWSSGSIAADVQAWVDNPGSNYGWLLMGNEANVRSSVRFNSRTNVDVGTRPELVIDFTPPAATGACDLPSGDCVVDTEGNCLAAGGTYLGDGTVCPDPMGACCLPDGSCVTDTAGNCAAMGGVYQGDGADCGSAICPVVLTPYVDPLTIPMIAVPTTGVAGGEATYDIPIVQVQQQLHSELPPTTLWTYNGVYPGPTFLASSGAPVTVHWINDLRDEFGDLRVDHILPVDPCPHGAADLAKTVVHLHGGHVPSEDDGQPELTIVPGEIDTHVYPMLQRAGLIWYHDHALGITRLNVYMGLAGAFIIRDAEEASLGLPSGEFEVPLIIQDRSFNADGSLSYPAVWAQQFFGDYNLVNGTVTPYMDVKRAKYRFRVLNGCNSRTYRFSLSNGMGFDLIGVDGGLLETPSAVTEITLASAERADILVDFSSLAPGTEIELVNTAPAPFPGSPGVGELPEVMKFIVGNDVGPAPATPPVLSVIEQLQETDSRMSRDFVMERESEPCAGSSWTINGLGWVDITERPLLGSTEIWRFINPTGTVHPMHMHLVFFQVLDKTPFEMVDGVPTPTGPAQPPSVSEMGWKDTVQVAPNEMVRVIARFEDYTGLFPYHCHILEHEDHEMMRQFEVVACPADLNDSGAPSPAFPGWGLPDGLVTPTDFSAFALFFSTGDLRADLNDAAAPSPAFPNFGVPDGLLTPTDFSAFAAYFAAGCPCTLPGCPK